MNDNKSKFKIKKIIKIKKRTYIKNSYNSQSPKIILFLKIIKITNSLKPKKKKKNSKEKKKK